MARHKRIVLSVGERRGRRVVTAFSHLSGIGSNYYRYRCDCGTEGVAPGHDIEKEDSCGCARRERAAARAKERMAARAEQMARNALARLEKKRAYYVWRAIRARCFNEANKHYPQYGGRGIKPCAWLAEGPQNLLALLGERPRGLHFNRIDREGGYWCGQCAECVALGRPLNVRWVTPSEEAVGRRKRSPNRGPKADARRREALGESLTLLEWAERYGLSKSCLAGRLRAGWPLEQALTTPIRNGGAKI